MPPPLLRRPAALPKGVARASYFVQLWTLKEAYVKALGRGISAPPGLRSFSFSVGGGSLQTGGGTADGTAGGATSGEQQHRCAENGAAALGTAPSKQQDSSNGPPGSAAAAAATADAAINFRTKAADARRWQFALMQPAPGHMAALCVELGGASECSSSASSSNGGEQQRLRVLNFETHPATLLRACGRPAELLLLAQGLHCPA